MIRDPSDGSVTPAANARAAGIDRPSTESLRNRYGPNWGLKSLDRPVKQPKPAPTAEELRQHYAKHNLGFEKKEQGV